MVVSACFSMPLAFGRRMPNPWTQLDWFTAEDPTLDYLQCHFPPFHPTESSLRTFTLLRADAPAVADQLAGK